MQIDLYCPVENQGVVVKTNSKTGEPYALFKFFNLSNRVVEAVAFTMRVYDAYGVELGKMRVDISDLSGQPKDFFATAKAVSLAQWEEAKHITTEFLEVHFAEGDPYIKEKDPVEITVTEPDYEEKLRLMTACGEDACCYAKDEGTHWICVCGRPNLDGVDRCVRCEREKIDVMRRFGSRDALNKTIAEQEEAQRLAEEAEKQAQEEACRVKKQRIKKRVISGLIGLGALLVLCGLLYLGYIGVMNLLGSRAAKNGDALTAYVRFAAAGNDSKIATISEEVKGNTSANLLQSGILAADEENIYYINPMCAIYKESKATGEKSRLGDAEGIFLNVSDGWVYYLDIVTGQEIHRISTDGATKEVVYNCGEDAIIGNLALVGNDLYFAVQEIRDDMTPELQEQIAQQGGDMYQYRLYNLTIGKEKAKRVSEYDINQFIYYKGRIYFLEMSENALFSMDRNGGDLKKLVSGPIYGFNLHRDTLYYVDGTVDETTGQPKLPLIAAEMDGTYRDAVVDDKMVMIFGLDGDTMTYLAYEDDNFVLYQEAGEEDIFLAEGCQLYNQINGYTAYLNMNGQLMKTTHDKSGFEVVAMELELPTDAISEELAIETEGDLIEE